MHQHTSTNSKQIVRYCVDDIQELYLTIDPKTKNQAVIFDLYLNEKFMSIKDTDQVEFEKVIEFTKNSGFFVEMFQQKVNK